MKAGRVLDKCNMIISPLVTEKSNLQSTEGKFSFTVQKSSSKDDIKKVLTELFGVEVVDINTLNIKGKTKRFRGKTYKKGDFKKVIVTLREGQTIDLAKLEVN